MDGALQHCVRRQEGRISEGRAQRAAAQQPAEAGWQWLPDGDISKTPTAGLQSEARAKLLRRHPEAPHADTEPSAAAGRGEVRLSPRRPGRRPIAAAGSGSSPAVASAGPRGPAEPQPQPGVSSSSRNTSMKQHRKSGSHDKCLTPQTRFEPGWGPHPQPFDCQRAGVRGERRAR